MNPGSPCPGLSDTLGRGIVMSPARGTIWAQVGPAELELPGPWSDPYGESNMHERTYCTNVDHKGRDCNRTIAPDSPLSLCPSCIEVAFYHHYDQMVVADPDETTAAYVAAATRFIDSIKADADARQTGHREFVARVSTELGGPSMETEDQVVYYVRFGDHVKIGTTSRLRERLGAIPHDELLAVEPGGYELERLRHAEFDAARLRPRGHTHNEWFALTDRLLAHCQMLREHYPQPEIRDRRFKDRAAS